jgi:hypothetical protein
MLGNDERTLAKFKNTILNQEAEKILEPGIQTIPMVPIRKQATEKTKFESKYLDSGVEIIFETSEEQLESVRDQTEQLSSYFKSQRGTILGRDRAESRTDEEWNSLMSKL